MIAISQVSNSKAAGTKSGTPQHLMWLTKANLPQFSVTSDLICRLLSTLLLAGDKDRPLPRSDHPKGFVIVSQCRQSN